MRLLSVYSVAIKHSLVICTRNRLNDIVTCLEVLACQVQQFDQIIIVDASDIPLNKQNRFVRVFHASHFAATALLYLHTFPGTSFQRNRGIEHATGDIIYFLDDDARIACDYLKRFADCFAQHPEYVGGMGDIIDLPRQSYWSYWFYRFFGLHGPAGSGAFTWAGMTKQAYGASTFRSVESLNGCAAYRTEVLKKYLFDEVLPGRAALEDADLSWRISRQYLLFFAPSVRLSHIPSTTGRDSMMRFHADHIRNYTYLF